MAGQEDYLSPIALSQDTWGGLLPGFLSDGDNAALFGGFMPGLSGSFSGFPAMSGLGSFTSPMSQAPAMSSFAFPDINLPPTGGERESPYSVNNYTEASNGETITVEQGDVIHVQLPARVDQGSTWNLTASDGLNVTATRMYLPEKLNSDIFSGTIVLQAIQEWDIQATKPGMQSVTAVYQGSRPGSTTYVLKVNVV